ncbi:M23 family metallopeptidase [Paraurantiacibacter namhicola]|uniref:Murein DD-endopeptidase MepM n=1 Tax=Paraurantiacibacter namhicola TaxID=645517 RepID=A0A1C7D5I9_9SPHN|nr:M23 family metallopeptidase [Paraurantiacibacter namhicola]ANU06727.1 Murein DD-endopeptidase MepM [Paraurantiacibacter namhicola]
MFTQADSEALPEGNRAQPASLSHDAIIGAPLRAKIAREGGTLGQRYENWRQAASARLSALDLAPDLASNIGSVRWLRGSATLLGLTVLAFAFWPDFSRLEAAPPVDIDEAARDEFRSQSIAPLALGADSGRRMGESRFVSQLASAPERPRMDVLATLAQGDGFARMLTRAGVGEAEAIRVAEMVGDAMPLSQIQSGTQVDITLGRRAAPDMPRPLDALSFRARFDLQLRVTRTDGRLVLDPVPIKVDTTPLRIRGKVGSSLYRSARAAGAPASAAQQYLRAVGNEVNLDTAISAADEFDLIVEYKRAATGEVEAGRLLYAGLVRDGKPKLQLMRWGPQGRFFEASGVGEQREGMVRPVPGRVSSNYGMRRHPILGYKRMHRGMDFKASHGQPIYAVTDGTVAMAGRNGGHGNYVKLTHGGGLQTGYSHMSRIAVRSGQRVRRGQVIGYVGSTGLSTGPHLHYEVYRNGRTVNPAGIKFVTRAQLEGAELQAFRGRLSSLQSVTPGAALVSLAPDPGLEERPEREIDRLERRRQVL